MIKQPLLEQEGTVIAVLGDIRYRVELDNGRVVLAYSAGRLRKKRLMRILVGDRVKLEISPDEISKGRIVYRYRN